MRKSRAFTIGVVGISAALLVGSAVAIAGPGKKGKGLVRGVHTEVSLIKADGSKDAFVVDRGQVTAESESAVTLKRKDGKSVTLKLSADTKVRGDIQVDKGVVGLLARRHGVCGARTARSQGGTASPRRRQQSPRPYREGQAGKGKGLMGAVHADVKLIKADGSSAAFSFDRGEVTAASDTSVTVKRADGPSVTKSISADTKLRGKLAVGGRAVIISQGSAATAILAAGPKA